MTAAATRALIVDDAALRERVPLAGGWSAWRAAVLRSTGFPVEGLDQLVDDAVGAAADRYRAGELSGEDYRARFSEAAETVGARLRAVATDDRFLRALVWQNRSAAGAADRVARHTGAGNAKHRARERLVARYWQRYCGKAETIGFFGPAAWVDLGAPGGELRHAPPTGTDIVADRHVVLESWAVIELARWMAEQPGVRAWLPPMLRPDTLLDGARALVGGRRAVRLTPEEALIAASADGETPAAELGSGFGMPRTTALETVARLAERQVLSWDGNISLGPDAEAQLARRVARIADPVAAAPCIAVLESLATHRADIEAAVDAETLDAALGALDRWFAALTGRAADRSSGASYAGRTLVYHDCVRADRVEVGADVLGAVGPALALVADSATWFSARLAQEYRADITREIVDARRRGRGAEVTLADVLARILPLFFGDAGDRAVDRAAAELSARWERVLDRLLAHADGTGAVRATAADLAPLVADEFGGAEPGWPHSVIHSPDLQLVATDPDAVARGEFRVVLGELHACMPSLDVPPLTWSIPGSVREAVDAECVLPRLVPLFPAGWRRNTGRFIPTTLGATEVAIGFAKASVIGRSRVVPAGAIVLQDDGSARTPDGRSWSFGQTFGSFLSIVAADAFKVGLPGALAPRVEIDRLVLFRETWRPEAGSLVLTARSDEAERYAVFRAWARHVGLPRRTYAKVPGEPKPLFVDLDSPVLVAGLLSTLRGDGAPRPDARLTFSEALPDRDDCWLRDADGARYVSEFRLHLSRTPEGIR